MIIGPEERKVILTSKDVSEYRVHYRFLNSEQEQSDIIEGKNIGDALNVISRTKGDIFNPTFFISIDKLDYEQKIIRTTKLQNDPKLQWFRVMWRDLASNYEANYYIVKAATPIEAIEKTEQEILEQPLYHKILFKYLIVDQRTKTKSWKEICRNLSPQIRHDPKSVQPADDELWKYYNESKPEFSQRLNDFIIMRFNKLNNLPQQLPIEVDHSDAIGMSWFPGSGTNTPTTDELEKYIKVSDAFERLDKLKEKFIRKPLRYFSQKLNWIKGKFKKFFKTKSAVKSEKQGEPIDLI